MREVKRGEEKRVKLLLSSRNEMSNANEAGPTFFGFPKP